MNINWPLVVDIVVPIASLFIGAWLNRVIERTAKLITYLGHTSVFEFHPTPETTAHCHTHSIVISNTGRKAATNVRVSHFQLPNYYIYPPTPHTVEDIPQGGKDIVLPNLVPGQQITVSYLYFPPVIWSQINNTTRSDEGFAKVQNVLPTRQLPKTINILAALFMFIGIITVIYFLILLSIRLFTVLH